MHSNWCTGHCSGCFLVVSIKAVIVSIVYLVLKETMSAEVHAQ